MFNNWAVLLKSIRPKKFQRILTCKLSPLTRFKCKPFHVRPKSHWIFLNTFWNVKIFKWCQKIIWEQNHQLCVKQLWKNVVCVLCLVTKHYFPLLTDHLWHRATWRFLFCKMTSFTCAKICSVAHSKDLVRHEKQFHQCNIFLFSNTNYFLKLPSRKGQSK